jgi:hypothetical protein
VRLARSIQIITVSLAFAFIAHPFALDLKTKGWINIVNPSLNSCLVRVEGLEPTHLAALDPKSSVSTNFTTPAAISIIHDRSLLLNSHTLDRALSVKRGAKVYIFLNYFALF